MHHKKQMNAVVHREVAYILQRYINDPRLQSVTVTMVTITKKLDYADIKISQLNKEYTQDETLDGLRKASSAIRHHLAQRTQLRRTPQLRFHYDTLLQKSIALSQLINKVLA